ncbi:MAG: 5-bromo-4-chloroindolyl phosphate hydrolysis family protein [Lachnospiraceae bacterium]|nr:5-bromo-4-chloroindolyl phosphate hydrolysis family protein [Lachnospiraceae bacterium]
MFWIIVIIWIIIVSNNKKQEQAQNRRFDQGTVYGPAAKPKEKIGAPRQAANPQPAYQPVKKRRSEWVKIILGALSVMGGIEEFTEVFSAGTEFAEVSDIVMALILVAIGAGAIGYGLHNMRLYNLCEGMIKKDGNTSIDAIAEAIGKPYDKTVSILSTMLRKNYFPNAYIDYKNRVLVMTKNGQPMETIVPYEGALCPFCHRPVEEDALFCEHCGKQIKNDEQVKEAHEKAAQKKKEEEKTKNLRELDALIAEIDEQEFTGKLRELKETSSKIFQKIEEDPELAASFRKFSNIYMPTIINAVKTYKSVRSAEYSIDETLESRKDALDALDMGIDAAKKLLGQLYDADQLNVSVDLEMLRRMMAADGLLQEQEDINSVQTDHHPS